MGSEFTYTTVSRQRTEQLREYLQSEIELDFRYPASESRMEAVDNCQTEISFVKKFLEMADGDFPENRNGFSKPPSQTDFALTVFYAGKSNDAELFEEEYKDCWMRRFEVTYPSLLRDLYFAYLLLDYNRRTQTFDSVVYDPDLDMNQGVDALVVDDGVEYHINLYVDTNKSQAYLRQKKDHRHPDKTADTVEVYLPIDPDDPAVDTIQLANGTDFWVYTEDHIEQIKSIVENN
jgi:hypothetical protein